MNLDHPTIFKQGAEALLYLSKYNGETCLVKERFVKKYRYSELDTQLTKERIRAECRQIARCGLVGVRAPKIYHSDLIDRKIYMEYFENATTVKDFITTLLPQKELVDEIEKLGRIIGANIGKMHANGIIHGDLTTSNMILSPVVSENPNDYEFVIIDFGLSRQHPSNEDKGVDLYVLERAMISTHSNVPHLFNIILDSYKENNPKNCYDAIRKYEEVRSRGRKRTMFG